MPKLSALQFMGFGKEATWGTSATNITYVPINSFKPEEEIKKVVDDGRRGNLSKDFNVFMATRSAKFDLETYLYTNEIGLLLASMLGAPVSGTAAPFTHEFKLANAIPPSLTLNDFNGINARQYTGGILEEMSFKFDPEKTVDVSVKGSAKPSAVIPMPTPAFGTTEPIMGVMSTFKLGGLGNVNLVGASIDMKREAKLLFGASGNQDPTKAAIGRLEVTGKVTFDIEDESEYLIFDRQDRTSLEFAFGNAANNQCVITMSSVDFSKATVDRSQEWVRVDADFRAIYNTTDAGPVHIKLVNTTASY